MTFAAPLKVPGLGTEIEIPGRWWNGASASERTAFFPIKVIENAPNHSFAGRPAPGVRIDLLNALGGVVQPGSGGWMTLKAFSEYKAEYDKKVEADRISTMAARLVGTAAERRDDQDEDESPGVVSERYKSLIRKFFSYTGTYEATGGGAGRGFNFFFKCLLGCGRIVKQWGPNELNDDGSMRVTNSTGKLSTWLQTHYFSVYEKYILGKSPYVRQRVIGGQLVKFYTFREAATCHIQYVLMCARDCRCVCLVLNFGKKKFPQMIRHYT